MLPTTSSQVRRLRGWASSRRKDKKSRMKAINSEAKPVLGVAKAVELKVGEWKGTVNLTTVPLDDFCII